MFSLGVCWKVVVLASLPHVSVVSCVWHSRAVNCWTVLGWHMSRTTTGTVRLSDLWPTLSLFLPQASLRLFSWFRPTWWEFSWLLEVKVEKKHFAPFAAFCWPCMHSLPSPTGLGKRLPLEMEGCQSHIPGVNWSEKGGHCGWQHGLELWGKDSKLDEKIFSCSFST
jgi:hypothetical protein